ncbi:hypothetical protein P280DRAFT_465084 [Massarina eburnea CBS 473.64]|uniref:Uncharacterized protein n=1 Tax=Massarina eburnea CBS 473.64 TaxID=1395130 RepID=A0A6A6SEN8_9PLEO|nr:hypothetical protein P280DRAFT_465084 [Massarina eburnea CBS 473.64]
MRLENRFEKDLNLDHTLKLDPEQRGATSALAALLLKSQIKLLESNRVAQLLIQGADPNTVHFIWERPVLNRIDGKYYPRPSHVRAEDFDTISHDQSRHYEHTIKDRPGYGQHVLWKICIPLVHAAIGDRDDLIELLAGAGARIRPARAFPHKPFDEHLLEQNPYYHALRSDDSNRL